MTISDFIERLKRLQSEMGTSAQVQIGKLYNDTQERFEFFEIMKSGKDVVLIAAHICIESDSKRSTS